MATSALSISKEEKGKVNGKVYCSVCKCHMQSSTDTPEQLKAKLEASGTHNHHRG